VRCLWCHKDVDAGWALCPDCGSELRPDLTTGAALPTFRPAGEPPFEPFVIASVRRFTPGGPFVVLGALGRVEANLVPAPGGVSCVDLDGGEIFRLERYEPAAGAVVAFAGNGEPLATYLPDGDGLRLRDGTSAPVARVRRQRGSDDNFDVIATGAEHRFASCWRQDCELGGMGDVIDEQWTLLPGDGPMPLPVLALAALPVVCAARFGRLPRPAAADVRPPSANWLVDLLR
jgi:hypothetical protein